MRSLQLFFVMLGLAFGISAHADGIQKKGNDWVYGTADGRDLSCGNLPPSQCRSHYTDALKKSTTADLQQDAINDAEYERAKEEQKKATEAETTKKSAQKWLDNQNNTDSVNAMVQECSDSTVKASNVCTPEKDSGLQAANMVGTGLLQQLNVVTLSNPQMACSGMGKFAIAANSALMTFQGYCSYEWTQCSNKCEENEDTIKKKLNKDMIAAQKCIAEGGTTCTPLQTAVDEDKKALADLRPLKRDCSRLVANIAGAVSNMGIIFGQLQILKQCEALTSNPLTLYCKSNPTAPLCSTANTAGNVDCSNASVAASNTVCICAANPMDSRCGRGGSTGGLANGNGIGGSGAGVDGGIGSAALSGSGAMGFGSEGDFGDGSGDVGTFANKNGSAAGGGRGGGGGGLGGLGGHGDTGGPGSGKAGAAGSSINTKILSGMSSGGSSGGGSRYGGGAGGGGYGGGKPGQNVDLRAFLPGGKLDPRRGLAGYSGPDGITGPNTDIWQKVKIRYNAVSTSLLP